MTVQSAGIHSGAASAAIAIDAGGAVDRHHDGRLRHLQQAAPGGSQYGSQLGFERQACAGAQNAIQQQGVTGEQVFKLFRLEILAEVDDLTAGGSQAGDQWVSGGTRADDRRGGTPAFFSKIVQGDQGVAAVVARADQTEGAAFFQVAVPVEQHFGQATPGVLHKLRIA